MSNVIKTALELTACFGLEQVLQGRHCERHIPFWIDLVHGSVFRLQMSGGGDLRCWVR
jgi:hypothetical protein